MYLIPILIAAAIELVLVVTTVVHILKHPNYRVGSMAVWIVVAVVFNILGCLAYFIFGKGDE